MSEEPSALFEAVGLLHQGERAAARAALERLWATLAPGAVLERVVVCHYLADAQDSAADELAWDVRALALASSDPAPSVAQPVGGAMLSVESFFPSLHLNLAAGYEKTGDLERAREHVRMAAAGAARLPDTPMAQGTASAIARLAARLERGVEP